MKLQSAKQTNFICYT